MWDQFGNDIDLENPTPLLNPVYVGWVALKEKQKLNMKLFKQKQIYVDESAPQNKRKILSFDHSVELRHGSICRKVR